MRKLFVVWVIIGICGSGNFSFASGKSVSEIEKMEIPELIELLNNPNWIDRDKAISYGLRKFREVDERGFAGRFKEFEGKEQLITALIRLLERENAIKEEWGEEYEEMGGEDLSKVELLNKKYGFCEGYGEYCYDLIEAVICLHDERTIDERIILVLVGSINGGWHLLLMNVVVEFGGLAIKPLLERLERTKDVSAKLNIIYALGEIAKRAKITLPSTDGTLTTKVSFKALTAFQIELMKNAFIKSLNDPKPFTRMEAIRGLEILGDISAIPLLKQIVENDLYKRGTVDPVTKAPKKGYYPVREEAQRVIKLLEEKKKQEEKEGKKAPKGKKESQEGVNDKKGKK